MDLKLPPFPQEYIEVTFLDEKLITDCSKANEYVKLQTECTLPFAVSPLYYAPVEEVRCLTNGEDVKTVLEFQFDIENLGIDYQPGGTIGILPENNPTEVNEIIERLGLNEFADRVYSLSVKNDSEKKKQAIPFHIPLVGTIRQVLLVSLNIRSVPKKAFLRLLSKYAADSNDVQRLEHLSSAQGSAEYTGTIINKKATLLDLLKMFPSINPPFERLLEHLPRLQPRPYSVSCSPLVDKNKLKFAFSILPEGSEGVCTAWLKKLADRISKENEKIKIPIYLRKPNSFCLPADQSAPIIMICHGTGIAPFIGFLQHRMHTMNNNYGMVWLFYGCRYSDHDYLYKNELKDFLRSGVLGRLDVSFSREGDKKYVQDRILDHSEEFIELIVKPKAVIYVCGDGDRMAKDVMNTIATCISKVMQVPDEDAKKLISIMQKSNRYIQDIWV